MKLFDTLFMNKRLGIIFFTTYYTLGLVSVLTGRIALYTCFLFFLLIIMIYKKFISERAAIVFFLVFAAGILNCSLRLKNSDYLSIFAPQNDITVVGRVITLPSASSFGFTKFTVETDKFALPNQDFQYDKSKTIVTLFAPPSVYRNIEIGDRISLTGRLTKPKFASNPSEFCYATYLKHKNIFSRLFVQEKDFSIISKPDKQPYKFLASLNSLRNKIISLHSENIQSPELELLGGIVFGDDAVNPTQEMKSDFQNSGLTHIIAASGMNVTIIFGMWFFISQILRIHYKLSIIIGMISVICYTCMTGFGPPVMRASLMLLLILFGKLIDRKSDSVSLLFIVAFILLLFSPTMITNIGFQLSFIVTFGLMCFCPLIFDKINSKIINTMLSFVIVPIIAQIFASPLQMFYFNSFSPYSVFANIAVVPTLSVVSFGGFASCILALIKPISVICVKFFDLILYPFLKLITGVAGFFANLPNSSITVPSPSVLQLVIYYSILIFLLLFFSVETANRKKFMLGSAITFFVLLLALIFIPKYGNDTEIIFFDVGNADCALIKTNKNKFILIDTGKAPYKNFTTSAERIVLKYFEDMGIKNLDIMVLSHYDADHSGGAGFIMDKINIEKLVVRSKDTNIPLAKYILQKADEKGINIIVPKNGEVIYSDGYTQFFSFYVTDGDDNETSIVNLLKIKDKMVLFTGDSGDSSLLQLKDYLPQDIDVLKVPHHGAKKTVSESLLKIINPKLSVISTGFNIYGHPAKETLSLLEKHSNCTLRTDKDNAVKVVFHKNEILVYSYNVHRKIFERIKND